VSRWRQIPNDRFGSAARNGYIALITCRLVGQKRAKSGSPVGVAERRDRRMVRAHVVMAPGPLDVEVVELRRRGQNDVSVPRGVGHEVLKHDGE
jgi:hypothetical protein